MNGKRVLTKYNALNAAREIIGRWKNLEGDKLDQYLDKRFEKNWNEYDYMHIGSMDTKDAYYWMRTLAGEEYFSG